MKLNSNDADALISVEYLQAEPFQCFPKETT